MKLIKTKMMDRYLIKFVFRICIFITIFIFYLTNKTLLLKLITTPISHGVTSLHIVWLIFMIMMFYHLFPKETLSMALLKSKKDTYEPQSNYDPLKLYQYILMSI